MRKVAQLVFTMPCPYQDDAGECTNFLDIRYRDQDDWDIEGCSHVEDPDIFEEMRNALEDAINEEAISQAMERAAARDYERSGGL